MSVINCFMLTYALYRYLSSVAKIRELWVISKVCVG